MKFFVKSTQKKISKAIKKLDTLSKNVSCNDFESQLNIALTRSDLIVAQKKLDLLNYFHTDRKTDKIKVIGQYFARKFQKRKLKKESTKKN
jgi:hypothetical protein